MNQTSVRRLHEDQRGAVMLTGLLMSCLLIGGLWFLIGIGDAIVFRQVMQEAPDHGGFASAVIHAKGMNFIALCNMIMLVLVTVYIILGIIHDIFMLLCVMTGIGCIPYVPVRTAWHTYFNFMKPFCRALHIAEEVAAYGAPWLGAGIGAKVGSNYGDKATAKKRSLWIMPLSSSMVPGRVGIPGRTTTTTTVQGEILPPERSPAPAATRRQGEVIDAEIISTTPRQLPGPAPRQLPPPGGGGQVQTQQQLPMLAVDQPSRQGQQQGQIVPYQGGGAVVPYQGGGGGAVVPYQGGGGQVVPYNGGGGGSLGTTPVTITEQGPWQVNTVTGINKYGLPVEAKKYSDLCDKVAGMGLNLLGLTGESAGIASGILSDLIQRGLKARYCAPFDISGFAASNDRQGRRVESVFGGVINWFKRAGSYLARSGIGALLGAADPSFDPFWREEGPLYVWSEARNGTVWMQIWTMNLMPEYGDGGKDTSFHRVGIAGKHWGAHSVKSQNGVTPRIYFAQAEFYYDCSTAWTNSACHGNAQREAHASFTMRWTNRMVAFNGDLGQVLGGLLGGIIGDRAMNLFNSTELGKFIKKLPKWMTDMVAVEGVDGEDRTGVNAIREVLGIGSGNEIGDAIGGGIVGATGLGMNGVPYH